jgi:hypothetical protein
MNEQETHIKLSEKRRRCVDSEPDIFRTTSTRNEKAIIIVSVHLFKICSDWEVVSTLFRISLLILEVMDSGC